MWITVELKLPLGMTIDVVEVPDVKKAILNKLLRISESGWSWLT